MITLQEIFNDLAYGEFAGMAVSNQKLGTITADKYPKMVSLINAGLLDLYTRFNLRTKEFNLHQRADKTVYYLRPEHVGDPLGVDPDIYLDGTVEGGLENDIIKITKAYDDLGYIIRINDARYPDDIFLVEQDILKMKPRDPLIIVSLVYQASYPRIVITNDFDPAAIKLYFPSYLKRALMAFMAAQLYTGKTSSSVEGQRNISSSFLYRYEAECARIQSLTLDYEVQEDNNQFERNGWS